MVGATDDFLDVTRIGVAIRLPSGLDRGEIDESVAVAGAGVDERSAELGVEVWGEQAHEHSEDDQLTGELGSSARR